MITNFSIEIPCLHRIHQGSPRINHNISHKIGMSVELSDLIVRLDSLNSTATSRGYADNSVLITFDDGWSDVLSLTEYFSHAKKLQPVLFLTHDQILGNSSLLPLSRLYAWCDHWSVDINSIPELGITREGLKSLSENLQHSILDDLEIPKTNSSSQVLSTKEIENLVDEGWIIASHAHDHHDMRFDEDEQLLQGLTQARIEIEKAGGEPWLAWPEGRCTMRTCDIAKQAGFTKQFGLDIESGNVSHPDLITRKIWS